MDGIHMVRLVVPESAIDLNGHVNNIEYLRWMQAIATSHSAARGWTLERYRQTRCSWVVRSHFIEYLRPAFAGQTLLLLTWIATTGQCESTRRYLFWREADRRLIAQAETAWVFVSARSGRKTRIPEEFRQVFKLLDDQQALLQQLEVGAFESEQGIGTLEGFAQM